MANFGETIFKNMRGIVTLTLNFGSLAIIIILLFVELPSGSNEIIYFVLGLWFGTLKDTTNYLFGGSKDKTDAEKAARLADPNVNAEISPPKKNKS